MKILITGAGGKTGKAIIKKLILAGLIIRALAYSEEHKNSLLALGVQEVLVGDMLNQEYVYRAARGVEKIYHICPNIHPNEYEIGKIAIAASTDAGVSHFIYHSVLHPQLKAMPHHWQKLQVEERIIESGLQYTILQPTAYMQNLTPRLPMIFESGVYEIPYSVSTKISLVDLEDVAEAATKLVTENTHFGATYQLCSSDHPDQLKIAELLSKKSNRRITARKITIEDWKNEQKSINMGDYQLATLAKMFSYYQDHHLIGNSSVLKMLLQRKPTSLKEFLYKQ